MSFTAEEAMEISLRHQENFNKTKSVIRQMINNEIKSAALRGRTSVIFPIPKSVYGRDTYSIVRMGEMIAQDLYADKYEVGGTVSRLLISWDPSPPPVPSSSSRAGTKSGIKRPVIKVPTPKKLSH